MTTEYRNPHFFTPTAAKANSAEYCPLANATSTWEATEANAAALYNTACTLKNFRCYVSANTAAGDCTMTVYQNGSPTSVTFTITNGVTGWYEDSTHTLAVSAGDLISVKGTWAGAGALTINAIGADMWAANAFQLVMGYNASNSAITTASTTRYHFGWPLSLSVNLSTEDQYKVRAYVPVAATAKFFSAHVITNSRTTTTTFNFRKNAGAGSQTLAVGSSATGWFTDSTHTDSLSAGDDFDYQSITGTGSGTTSTRCLSVELHGSGASLNALSGNANTLLTNTTRYTVFIGASSLITTEANVEVKMRGTGTFRNFSCETDTNSANQDTVWTVRKNGADTALTVTFSASTTGRQTDSTHSFTFADGDTIAIKGARASGGSGNFTAPKFSVQIDLDAEGAGGTVIPVFMNQYRQRWN